MKDIFKLQLITIRLVLLTSFCIQKMDKNIEMVVPATSTAHDGNAYHWHCLLPMWSQHTHTYILHPLWFRGPKPQNTPLLTTTRGILVFEKQTLRNPFFSNLTLVCISSLNKSPCIGTLTINCLNTISPSSSCCGFMQVT